MIKRLFLALMICLPSISFADITEHFAGENLPSGWTFVDPATSGSTYTVSNSRVNITMPELVTIDSIASTSSPDNSVGVIHALSPGDLDIAVQWDTDISQYGGLGAAILFINGSDACRFSIYQSSDTSISPSFYIYHRAGGSGSSVGPALLNTVVNYLGGMPAWGRVTYIAAIGQWTFYLSTDGANWIQFAQFTRSFTPNTFKVSAHSTTPRPGGTVRIQQVIDVLANGDTDLREPIPEYTRVPAMSFLGSDGALPTELSDDSALSGSITWTGTAMRMTSNISTDGSRARVIYSGPSYENCGTLLSFRFWQSSTSSYIAFGVGVDTGGIDQYSRGPGYAWELTGGSFRRFLRVDEPGTVSVWNSDYTFIYDISDVSLGGTPGPLTWGRVEKIGPRVRARYWLDGQPEPTTWHYDGQDQIIDGPYGFGLGFSHNDGLTGGDHYVDIYSSDFYQISTQTSNFDASPAAIMIGF